MSSPATFYFDIGSPYAYLAAERVDALLPGVRWQPISLGGLFKANGRGSWALGDRWRRDLGMHEIERRAAGYGLAPVRWPQPWPSRYLTVMRAVTFAFSIEHGPSFALAAFQAMFVDGLDLALEANVLKVAWDAGLDPREVQEAVGDPAVKAALHSATDAAHAAGVIGVPTVAVGRRLFWGDDELENAAAAAAGLS